MESLNRPMARLAEYCTNIQCRRFSDRAEKLESGRKVHTPMFDAVGLELLKALLVAWCRGPDSNRQAVKRRILSIASLFVNTGFCLALHGKSRVSGLRNAVYVNSDLQC
jgi:hypothetical protein